ncbi:MAG: zincin-like metallopeptidase domain-containing protein, partial [Hyphomicrobium sp.]
AEELVAEIGSAMVCAMLEITQDVRPDHAQYLAHWLELMKSDPKAIFTAASKASQATASEAIVAAPELEVEARAPAPDESDRAPQRTPVVVNRRGQFDFGF